LTEIVHPPAAPAYRTHSNSRPIPSWPIYQEGIDTGDAAIASADLIVIVGNARRHGHVGNTVTDKCG